MANLEPIEESDLDLKSKLVGSPEKTGLASGGNPKEKSDFALEQIPESRQEGRAEKDASYSKILSKVQSQTATDHDHAVSADAKELSDADGEEAKIETLLKLAGTKGVAHAVKVAQHLEDNYALDEFHDRLLADELHDALVKKGMIGEV